MDLLRPHYFLCLIYLCSCFVFCLIAAEVDFQPGQRDHDASGLLYLPVQRQQQVSHTTSSHPLFFPNSSFADRCFNHPFLLPVHSQPNLLSPGWWRSLCSSPTLPQPTTSTPGSPRWPCSADTLRRKPKWWTSCRSSVASWGSTSTCRPQERYTSVSTFYLTQTPTFTSHLSFKGF